MVAHDPPMAEWHEVAHVNTSHAAPARCGLGSLPLFGLGFVY